MPTKKLARVKLLVNWYHHPSCLPTRLFLLHVFTASSYFHLLLSASCFLLLPGAKAAHRVYGHAARTIEASIPWCASVRPQPQSPTRAQRGPWRDWAGGQTSRSPSAQHCIPHSPCCSQSPPSLHHSTGKTCSISTFRERLYEKSDAEALLKYPHIYICKSTSRGMVRVSLNLMLNSIVIWVGRIFPPKTCCPQTASCHQSLQKAYEGWRNLLWGGQRFCSPYREGLRQPKSS